MVGLVAIGAGLGAVCRFWVTQLAKRKWPTLPLATVIVNVLGALILGLVAGSSLNTWWQQFLMVGFCGGFTTFSTFAVDELVLLNNRRYLVAGSYYLGTTLLGILSLLIGISIMA